MRYIYNTNGDYVAFISGGNLFSPSGRWLGTVTSTNEIYYPNGKFLGYLLDDDRVATKSTEHYKLPGLPALPPLPPMLPLRPFQRLPMAALPFPYQDVFAEGPDADESKDDLSDLNRLLNCELVANDGQLLGKVISNRYMQDSILNQFGPFGSRYSDTSIFNKYGKYGSKYSALSPFNKYSNTPPRFTKKYHKLDYLSVNTYLNPRVDPTRFMRWLGRNQRT